MARNCLPPISLTRRLPQDTRFYCLVNLFCTWVRKSGKRLDPLQWTAYCCTSFLQNMSVRSSGMNKCRGRQDAGSDNLGCLHILMPQQFCAAHGCANAASARMRKSGHGTNIVAIFKQMRCERMTQCMRTSRFVYLCFHKRTFHCTLQGTIIHMMSSSSSCHRIG